VILQGFPEPLSGSASILSTPSLVWPTYRASRLEESMQSCGVFKQRQQAGVGLRVGESPGANGEMHLPEWR
jgi:hypothetical protein